MYQSSVDLRSNIDSVYDQSDTPACGPHAVVNALDILADRSGKSQRFSRSFIWWWSRFWLGAVGQNTGSTIPSLTAALGKSGAMLESECPWDKPLWPMPTKGTSEWVMERTSTTDFVNNLKRLLCMGVPVIYLMQTSDEMMSLKGDWRTHTWPWPAAPRGEHFVCIVGYDDAAERFLVENSWGAAWGDGGFFGIPYSLIGQPGLFQGVCHVDRGPILPTPVEGYTVTAPTALTWQEAIAFSTASKTALTETLMAAFATGGAEKLVTEMARWGVSDKHVEVLAGWPRGTVRQFAADNPALDWSKQVWDQI